MTLVWVLAILVASGGVLVLAGGALARAADAIAEATGIGRVWVGTVLLAGATSLPELTTDIAAVRLGAPDLAVGDLFGSTMANMLILAMLDLWPPRRQILRHATFDHALAGCLAIGMTVVAAMFIVAPTRFTILGIGPGSIVLVVMYLAGTRAIYRQGIRTPEVRPAKAPRADGPPAEAPLTDGSPAEAPLTDALPATTATRAILRFVVLAVVILAVAPPFAWSAHRLAEISGLGSTFVGTVLVGLSTSLPELVASLAAIRMGAFDLAVGNLFGSNGFNMIVFFALDIAQPGGSVFNAIESTHVISALLGVLLMSVGLAAIVYRAQRRVALAEPSSALMVLIYLLGLGALYAQVAS